MSWDQNTAATTRPSAINVAVWSPCSRFIAITWDGAATTDVLDSVTLQRLQTFESPRDISTKDRVLVFSPDSRILTCSGGGYTRNRVDWHDWGSDDGNRERFVCSWDLQTGGLASIIRWQGPDHPLARSSSTTYSVNGQMVGVFCHYLDHSSIIFICDVASGTYMHSHSLSIYLPPFGDIWTHGECLRFTTIGVTGDGWRLINFKIINIWEVGFTPGVTPTVVETLPCPGDFLPESHHFDPSTHQLPPTHQLLPTLCRLSFTFQGRILVWDAWKSEYLLDCTDTTFYRSMCFSSDGGFFACPTPGSDIYLWKESPAGYALHGILASNTVSSNPLLSPNGESILAFGGHTIQLWRTTGFAIPPSSTLTRAPRRNDSFVLQFCPDGMLAVVAMRQDRMVTVVDLKSGASRLTIDTGMKVYGVGVVGDIVVVVGEWEIITWNLPAGDWVDREDSAQIATYSHWSGLKGPIGSVAISPDLSWIAIAGSTLVIDGLYIHIYRSTGSLLGIRMTSGNIPRFTPDGCRVWCATDNKAEVWRVGGRRELECLEEKVDIERPPEGCPWGSSRGYQVTNDWWILGPDGKRLLMLPPRWQSYVVHRVWKGQFLALLHGGLLEPVILEMEP